MYCEERRICSFLYGPSLNLILKYYLAMKVEIIALVIYPPPEEVYYYDRDRVALAVQRRWVWQSTHGRERGPITHFTVRMERRERRIEKEKRNGRGRMRKRDREKERGGSKGEGERSERGRETDRQGGGDTKESDLNIIWSLYGHP